MQIQNKIKQDEFRVGDVVWDTAYGKGKVVFLDDDAQPVRVAYDSGGYSWYTQDGKLVNALNRTLFFSEPKIEASVTRPFVPTLVGKRVVVLPAFDTSAVRLLTIFKEDKERIYVTEEGHYWDKDKIAEMYEVSSENLLKS